MTVHVFYHGSDFDGICSAAIVYRATFMNTPDLRLYPINYGDDFPWGEINKDDEVVMVDFALQPYELMLKLQEKAAKVTWIDHHKTAIESPHLVHCGLPGKREIGTAACELTWEYYEPDWPMPKVVRLLGRYDVWDHEDENTLPFQYAARMDKRLQDPKAALWQGLFLDGGNAVENMLISGRYILDYIRQENEKYATTMFELEWKGLRFLVANRCLANSLVFESRYNPEKHDAMMAFGFYRNKWCFSLYSDKPEIDVSAIAVEMGGGGHKGAAGFSATEIPFALPKKR